MTVRRAPSRKKKVTKKKVAKKKVTKKVAKKRPKKKPHERGPGRPFKKGKTGNPNGRPLVYPDVAALAKVHTIDAIKAIVELMKCTAPIIRLKAACAVLDRGWGKPRQAVEVSGEGGGPLTTQIILVDPKE